MLNPLDKPKIIWTRSVDDFKEDQHVFAEMKSAVLHLPCLTTRSVGSLEAPPQLAKDFAPTYEKAAIFTSWRAVHFALMHDSIRDYLERARLFCFGEKTRSYLQERSFPVEFFTDLRTAREIPNALREVLSTQSFILLPGPTKRAFNLEFALREIGYQALAVSLYETLPILQLPELRPPSSSERQGLIDTLSGVVFFASPSACEGFCRALSPQTNRLHDALTVLALGDTTAQYCRKFFKHVHTSEHNDLKSAFSKITTLLKTF